MTLQQSGSSAGYVPDWLREKAEELLELAEDAGTPIVVTGHKNADPDALAAAYVIRNILRSRGLDARLVLPEGLSQPSKRVAREILGVEPADVEDEPPEESALAVVVDTASPEQLGRLAEFVLQVDFVVIDHHESNRLAEKAALAIVDTSAKANAEIVYMMARHIYGVNLSRQELEVLLSGIVYDTRHFVLSTARTLRIAAELMEAGASLERVLRALQSPPMEIAERIARIKAAKRMHALRAGDYIVAVTNVGAYESSVARALLDLGADMALIVSEHGDEVRVIGRARKSIVEKLDVHLGRDIMEPLGSMFGGGGGGHAQAAGATVRADLERVYAALLELLEKLLKSKGLEPQALA
ncbi:DHH family phosphoesterase [Hyperthermus butylicus]|uniref:Phosphoesterase, DHH family n=1 Tax=Hyperthermus butylicus (strain DSM 5456 / JCM 9403 / PLM1-5) TaxID=415426 RepID=A2BKC6_HYPBU|nr:DHH family phosphoesterase [Hyperthermus butylicus]ABM80437.1 putative phosphoesterase, DHH family [Hyperthermus butylicus DSM 5456]